MAQAGDDVVHGAGRGLEHAAHADEAVDQAVEIAIRDAHARGAVGTPLPYPRGRVQGSMRESQLGEFSP